MSWFRPANDVHRSALADSTAWHSNVGVMVSLRLAASMSIQLTPSLTSWYWDVLTAVNRALFQPPGWIGLHVPGVPLPMQTHRTSFMSTTTSPLKCWSVVGGPAVPVGLRARWARPPVNQPPTPSALPKPATP